MRNNQKYEHVINDFRPLNFNNYMIGIDYLFFCSTKLQKNRH